MKKFEYKIITHRTSMANLVGLTFCDVNELDELGSIGWELINVVIIYLDRFQRSSVQSYIFKREIETKINS